jgi:hypothetical protein
VEQVFADGASGGGDFMNRSALVSMSHYLDQHKQTPYIIFDDLKRLAKDTQSHFRLRQALALRGSKVEGLNFKF